MREISESIKDLLQKKVLRWIIFLNRKKYKFSQFVNTKLWSRSLSPEHFSRVLSIFQRSWFLFFWIRNFLTCGTVLTFPAFVICSAIRISVMSDIFVFQASFAFFFFACSSSRFLFFWKLFSFCILQVRLDQLFFPLLCFEASKFWEEGLRVLPEIWILRLCSFVAVVFSIDVREVEGFLWISLLEEMFSRVCKFLVGRW